MHHSVILNYNTTTRVKTFLALFGRVRNWKVARRRLPPAILIQLPATELKQKAKHGPCRTRTHGRAGGSVTFVIAGDRYRIAAPRTALLESEQG